MGSPLHDDTDDRPPCTLGTPTAPSTDDGRPVVTIDTGGLL